MIHTRSLAASVALSSSAAFAQTGPLPDDIGDTPPQARLIQIGQSLQGRFDYKGDLEPDVDLYKVSLPAGRVIGARITFIDPPENLWREFFLPTPDWQVTEGLVNRVLDVSTTPRMTVSPGGDIYIRASSLARPDTTPVRYTLTIDDGGPRGEIPFSETFLASTLVSPNTWFDVTASPLGPRTISPFSRYAAVRVRRGEIVVLDSDPPRFFDVSNGALAFLSDARTPDPRSGPEAAFFQFPLLNGNAAPADGRVVARLDALVGSRARIRLLPPRRENDTSSVTSPLPLSATGAFNGTIETSTDVDAFSFAGQRGDIVRVTWSPFANADIRLVGPTGETISETFLPTRGYYLPTSGTYSLYVQQRLGSSLPSPYTGTCTRVGTFDPDLPPVAPTPLTLDGAWVAATTSPDPQRYSVALPPNIMFRVTIEAPFESRVGASVLAAGNITGAGVGLRLPINGGTTGLTTGRRLYISPEFSSSAIVTVSSALSEPAGQPYRLRVDRLTASSDDLADGPETAPVVPPNQFIQNSSDRLFDFDCVRVSVSPGRRYRVLSSEWLADGTAPVALTNDGSGSAELTFGAAGTAAIRASAESTLGLVDLGPGPNPFGGTDGAMILDVPVTFTGAFRQAFVSLALPALPGEVLAVETTGDLVATGTIIDASRYSATQFHATPLFFTPTGWTTPPVRAALSLPSLSTGVNPVPVRSGTATLRRIATPARIVPDTPRPVGIGLTDWAYTDLNDEAGRWLVTLAPERLYRIDIGGVDSTYAGLGRSTSQFPDAYESDFGITSIRTGETEQTLRVLAPIPGRAGSLTVTDLGPAPADDSASRAQPRVLPLADRAATGAAEFVGDTDWFLVTADRPRAVSLQAVSLDNPSSQTFQVRFPAAPPTPAWRGQFATVSPDAPLPVQIVSFSRSGQLPGTLLSPAARYRLVLTPLSIADFAGPDQSTTPDGDLTADDIIAYISAFAAGAPRADIAGLNQDPYPDNQLTADDLIVFINAYVQGQ